MTTTNDLIERTRRHLYSGETRDERDKLDGTITAGATSLAITFTRPGVQVGSLLAIDLEEMHVDDVSGATVTVTRGEGGSTAAAHTDGAIIYINPPYSPFAVLQSLNDELLALHSEGLYRTRTVDLTYASGTDAYDLAGATDVTDVLDVEFFVADGSARWATLPRSQWKLRRDLPTTSFASGLALTVNGYAASGQTLRVAYKAPYSVLATIADNVETVSGLPASAHDIPPLGAAVRLIAGAEVSRNFLDQYETRRADEVPAGARGGMMRSLMALRNERINAERARLYSKNPMVRG